MRIGIYNRWLHTLGGGEREVAALAQALQDEHTVELITHQPIDLAYFAERLNARLPRVNLRIVPDDPQHTAVIRASTDYDLFFNMSHGDLFTPRAGKNVLRVFFPDSPEAGLVTATPAPVVLIDGFYQPETAADRAFAWTGPQARFQITPPVGDTPALDLEIMLHGWRPPGAPAATVGLRMGDALSARREVPRDGAWTTWRVRLPAAPATVTLDTTTFNARSLGIGDDNRELGVAIAAIRLVPRRRWFGAAQPTTGIVLDRQAWAAIPPRPVREIAASYDRLLANSRFTQHWIERRWALPSDLLYPPVELRQDALGDPRRPIIVSIGRFFAGGHNKKHLPMIAAFRAICDAGLRGWEYHLAGGCDLSMPEHRAYLEQVRAAAAGYPIYLHVDAPSAELRELTATAQIFWHATGYGEDEQQTPERMEHFGITTVEAMAAGCVPVVIARGGQVEIVEQNVSGLLWQTLPELQAQTRALIEDPLLCARLAAGARQRSRIFGMQRFKADLLALIEPLRR